MPKQRSVQDNNDMSDLDQEAQAPESALEEGKDFDYITIPVQAPNVLVAGPAQKARTVKEVIATLKAKPGKLSFASSGNCSSDHLSAELFWQQTGTEAMHVPYKGGAPAITDLIGGQVDFSFQNGKKEKLKK